MNILRTLLIACTLIAAMAQPGWGQSRAYIRNAIEIWGECKSVAITATGGDVAIYGKNGYATTDGVPAGLVKALKELHDDGETINDVTLTEDGEYLVLYGDNGMTYNFDNEDLEAKMKEYNDNGYTITSVALNTAGDWIIISEEYYAASSSAITEFLSEGAETYGALYAVHITRASLVAVYARGYKFYGDVPETLREALKTTDKDIYRVKFTEDGAYFIADRKGWYQYRM